jgi:hypothetical protein
MWILEKLIRLAQSRPAVWFATPEVAASAKAHAV